MAKKKSQQYVKEINDECKKKYGNIIKTGRDVLNNRRDHKMMSVSPSMDYGLNGGVKEGTVMIMSGADKSGKTTMALHIAAKHQNDPDFVKPDGTKGRKVFYFNSEERLDEKHLEGIRGLNPDDMVVLEKDKGKPCPPAEVLLNAALSVMRDPDNEGSIIIIDSTSNMQSEKQASRGVSSSFSDMPKILADFCRKFSPIIPEQKILMIIITHLIANPQPYGPSKVPDCGNKIRHAADTILRIKSISRWFEKKDTGPQIGQEVHWVADCSTHGTPGTKIDSWLRYGIGIDEAKEAIEIGTQFGIIERSGAWFYPYGLDSEVKFQGAQKFQSWLEENPDYVKEVIDNIRLALSEPEDEDSEEEE
jgi:recombination protein RecA